MPKILITGASGFLGSTLVPHLLRLHHSLTTIGITDTDNIHCNLASSIPNIDTNFDWVIHAAGKAHVVPSNSNAIAEFYQVNLEGTKNLLKGLEETDKLPKAIVFISTVAVYGIESGTNITEEYPLLGNSPYALSKIQAEEYLKIWCLKNNVKLSILRPSLIAGKKAPGNLGAMISGIKTGKYFRVGNGLAQKSILMAEDIGNLIPKLVEIGGIYNVCDNHHPSFAELDELIANQLNKKAPMSIPYFAAKSLALIGDLVGNKFPINSGKLYKIVQSLTFSNEKAKRELDWEPLDVLQNFQIK